MSRVIRCPACEVQYDQDECVDDAGNFCPGRIACGQPGAEFCSARRRWADTEIPPDGLLDYTAINLAVSGMRQVRLTSAEAAVALRRMVDRDPSIPPQDAAQRLGLTVRQMIPLLTQAGLGLSCGAPSAPTRFLSLVA